MRPCGAGAGGGWPGTCSLRGIYALAAGSGRRLLWGTETLDGHVARGGTSLFPLCPLPWSALRRGADRPLRGRLQRTTLLHLVDLHRHDPGRPGLEPNTLREEFPELAEDRQERKRDEDPRQPVELAAGEQTEDDEQRMQAERAAHELRHDDVALDLVDGEEEQRDPDRRHRVDDE